MRRSEAKAFGAAARAAAVLPLAFALQAYDERPMSYLRGAGEKAAPVVSLTWGLLLLSIVVVVVITALVLAGVWRRRTSVPSEHIALVPPQRPGGGVRWIAIGVGVSSVALLASLIWTVATLAAVNGPPRPTPFTIEVTGKQWWWDVDYRSADPSQSFRTANEIHIPVGVPVRLRVRSADVIHSFWVPRLAGRMDTIPGQVNETWIEAREPGVYRGQCTEYCGLQHAHMALLVVADPPAAFQAWRAGQLLPARPIPVPVVQAASTEPAVALVPRAAVGAQIVQLRCGTCHAIRGTDAGGRTAPDLTHLMSRRTLAAGTLPNSVGNLSGWIANPQAVKPGAHMPVLGLSGPELADVRAYLETLV